jgi:uncharacterized protein YecT (DUF1311 family)
MTQDEALRVAMDWYGSGNQDPDEFEKLIKAIAAQRTWVGLMDADCDEVERWVEFKEEGSGRIPMQKLIRYIETKLKEKNA